MGKTLFASGWLAPGASHFWFRDNVDKGKARTFTAVPEWYGLDVSVGGETAKFGVADDQQVMVGEVFHLLKGVQHSPPARNTLQVNVEVRNRRTDAWCSYSLYMWES